ncbi:MAG: ornithine carbamoyltransferase [Candidatus Ranarchaeia archaeon]
MVQVNLHLNYEVNLVTKISQPHCLTLQDYTFNEIKLILQVAAHLKRRQQIGDSPDNLKRKTLGMIFQKPSTRTRVSFEVAMNQLGGSAVYLNWGDLQLGRGESIADTARALSRYVDIIMARVYHHKDLETLAAYSEVPVINGLTDKYHPCQVLGDLLTINEALGRTAGVILAYVGDGNNVCQSLMVAGTKMGMRIRIACPRRYRPQADVIEMAETNAKNTKGSILITEDPSDAVANADVIYTDTFVSMGQESEKKEKIKALQNYQVNQTLVKNAKENYLFMHCLPAYRGIEVTAQVLDDTRHSVIWDQAENRLHAQKALLTLLVAH